MCDSILNHPNFRLCSTPRRSPDQETVCGTNARWANTRAARAAIERWVGDYDIQTIADLGCGDLNWLRGVDFAALGVEYTGYDVKDYRGPNAPDLPVVVPFDLSSALLPQVDAILCKDVLPHYPNEAVRWILDRFKAVAPLLIATNHPDVDNAKRPYAGRDGEWPGMRYTNLNLGAMLGDEVEILDEVHYGAHNARLLIAGWKG